MKKLIAIALLALLGCSKSSTESGAPAASASATPAPGKTIRLGQSAAYSGPLSSFSNITKAEVAYMGMLNEKGGVHGRTVELLSYDDAYTAAKTVEQTRKLVESDNVLAIFGTTGTACNMAIQPYLEQKKIPQLFITTGADRFSDPAHPLTVGWQPSYRMEARLYARYVKEHKPNAKMCVLFQNDGMGVDYQAGLADVFGADKDKIINKTISYEPTDATIDSQIVTLQGSGCDTIMIAASPKFAAQAIRKIADIGWKPLEFLINVSSSVIATLKLAGLDKAVGAITADYLKDPSDPKLASDPGIVEYLAFMKKYLPTMDTSDHYTLYGYAVAMTMQHVLEQCGDDVSRENIMKQALNLKNIQLPVALDGVVLDTGPADYRPLGGMRLEKFNGTNWEIISEVLKAE